MRSGEPGVQEIENILFEQAAAQGQTVVAPAGDSRVRRLRVDGRRRSRRSSRSTIPPASPTSSVSGGRHCTGTGSSATETVWNQGAEGQGGGGGLSATWTAPGWQVDSGVPGIAAGTVIARAKHHPGSTFCSPRAVRVPRGARRERGGRPRGAGGVTVFYQGHWTVDGGTSSAVPIWAALLADVASTTGCRARSGLGFAPPLLYTVAADPTTYSDLLLRRHRRQQCPAARLVGSLPGDPRLRHGVRSGHAPAHRSPRGTGTRRRPLRGGDRCDPPDA